MKLIGKLAFLLAAVGVGVAPSMAPAMSKQLLAQQFSPSLLRLNVPTTTINKPASSTTKKKSSSVGSDSNKSKKTIQYKPPKTKYEKPKTPKYEKPKTPKYEKPKTPKYEKPKTPKYEKPKTPKYEKLKTPKYEKSPQTTNPTQPKLTPKEPRRRSYISLRKPILACRSFRKDGNLVRGFKVRLYGQRPTSTASILRSKLFSYQTSGGSLSRCLYSGVIAPSIFIKYFNGRKPQALIRSSDNYKLPLYSSFSQLLEASNGRRARFGLIASTSSVRSSRGQQDLLRITANNALILFIDGRNQSLFKAPPSRLPLRLFSISSQVREVLSDASKSSLKRMIDYKKKRKTSLKKSSLFPSEWEWGQDSESYFNALSIAAASSHSGLGVLAQLDNVGPWMQVLPSINANRVQLLAEVDPQIAETCMQAQDFSGCVETLQGSSESEYQDSGSNEESDDYSSECPEGEIFDFDMGECLPDDFSDNGSDDSQYEYVDDYGEESETGFDDEQDSDYIEEDDYDIGDGQYPDDMGAPTGQACTGKTFGEQLACALISALTTMLQQAFTTN